MNKHNFILASGSPRRQFLLKEQGYHFDIVSPQVTETCVIKLNSEDTAIENSNKKAVHVASLYKNTVVLSADTIVVHNNKILGKPTDDINAMQMLLLLNNSKHTVITAYSIVVFSNDTIKIIKQEAVKTLVYFADFDKKTYQAYIASGEPFDKAGAYAIQGIGGKFIEKIHGSYSNVVGLPLYEVIQGLKLAGINYPWE